MLLISTLGVITYLICGNNQNWLPNLNLIYETLDWGRKWLVDFNAGKPQLVLFDRSNSTGAIDIEMDESVLKEKSSFKMLGLSFCSKLDWGPYIRSMKFLSPFSYLYKSTMQPCIDCCCHICGGAPSCSLS